MTVENSVLDNTYIYLVICPLSGNVLHIDYGYKPKISSQIKKSTFYGEWRNSMKVAKEKPIYLIIDHVKAKEVGFWLEYYEGLYSTWGFELWNSKVKDQLRTAFVRRSNNIVYHLVDNMDNIEISNHVYNYGHLIQLIGSLLKIKFIARELDEMTVVIILCYFYGKDLHHFISKSMGELRDLILYGTPQDSPLYYEKLDQFILDYVKQYSFGKSLTKAFENKINSKKLDNRLKNVSKYFGYQIEIKYSDHQTLSKLMMFELAETYGVEQKHLESAIQSSKGYLQYMLMTNNSKSFYLDNILFFKEVFSLDIKKKRVYKTLLNKCY